jgi:hypothetical protein
MFLVSPQRGIPSFFMNDGTWPQATRPFARFDRIRATCVRRTSTLREPTLVKGVDTTNSCATFQLPHRILATRRACPRRL